MRPFRALLCCGVTSARQNDENNYEVEEAPHPIQLQDNLQTEDPFTANLSRYVYEPLQDQDKIRVLTLLGTFDNRIECTVEQISASRGGYQALSYVWGSEDNSFRAVVRDRSGKCLGWLPLTTNLNSALRDLWNAKAVKSNVFWIDQICIDQNGTEKNHQVSMMGAIYMKADRVITYLGPAVNLDLEQKGVRLLQKLDTHFEPYYHRLSGFVSLAEAIDYRPRLPASSSFLDREDFESEQTWQWLASICIGEWATRLWIVQEQLLNTEVIMLRGPRLISWNAVAIVPALFYLGSLPLHYFTNFWRENRADIEAQPAHIADSVFALWVYRRQIEFPSQNNGRGGYIPILNHIASSDGLQCRDSRDRIFALLAVSSDATELKIVPDYSKSVSDVFHAASLAIIRRSRNLDILAITCRQDNLSDPHHPSWCLNQPRTTLLIPDTVPFGICQPHLHRHLCASCPPRFQANQKSMVLRGRIVDRISFVTARLCKSHSFVFGVEDEAYMRTTEQIVWNLSLVLSNLGVTLENAAALCFAIVLNQTWSPVEPLDRSRVLDTQEAAFYFWCYFRTRSYSMAYISKKFGFQISETIGMCNRIINDLAVLLARTTVEYHAENAILDRAENAAASRTWEAQRLQGRTFCATENRRTCSAMNEAKAGDVIAAFEGADRLFVLRPVRNQYQLIGDAYVHGLMEGESYQDLDPHEVDCDIELI